MAAELLKAIVANLGAALRAAIDNGPDTLGHLGGGGSRWCAGHAGPRWRLRGWYPCCGVVTRR